VELSSALHSIDTPLPVGTTRAEFCTGRFRISADIQTADKRLLEIMRDTTRHYLELRRMVVRAMDGHDQVATYPDGLLNKSEIDWVAVRAEPSRAEGRLYGFVKKMPVRVALLLGSHRIEGNVFVETSGTDPVSYFLRGIEKTGDRYLAVGSATITSSSGAIDEAPLVIANRNAVRLFSIVH
jgi:hypothetical protein